MKSINFISDITIALCSISLLLFSSCNTKLHSEDNSELTVVKFEEDSKLFRPAELFKNIYCVQLETTEKSVLGEIKRIIDVEGNLVVLTKDNEVMVFNREDGKYLRHLGCSGEGPEEYIDAKDMFYDSTSSTINVYDRMRGDIVSFRLNGEFSGKTRLPESLPYIESMEMAQDGSILICNQLTGGLVNDQKYAFTLIRPDGKYENFDPFAPVTADGKAVVYASRPMSACGDELKYVGFLSDTISCIKGGNIEPLYKLDLKNKIVRKEVAAEWRYAPGFYSYCIEANLISSIGNMYETDQYILLIPVYEYTYGYYWIDKETGGGYHISSTMEVNSEIRKVVQGKTILELKGYNGKELISCFENAGNQKLFQEAFAENPDDVALPESVVSAIENIDPDGNPFLLIYSN